MFTIDQIKAAHSKVKSGADFPAYIQELKQLGVQNYTSYVTDGHTDYTGNNSFATSSEAKYAAKQIAAESNSEQFISDLRNHQKGGTDYPTFCNDCAKSGIDNWVVDLNKMTCIYYDTMGTEILVEQIPG